MSKFVVCIIFFIFKCIVADNIVDMLDIDIDISEFRNADHDGGEFHEDDLLRFFLQDGTVICEGKLQGAVDSKIPCTFDKRTLRSGPNEIYHAVFTKEVDGEWVELENSRDIMTLDLPAETAAITKPQPILFTPRNIIAASISAVVVGSGTKYLIDLRPPEPISLPIEEIPFEEPIEEEILFPVEEETFPIVPPVVAPKPSPFLSTMQGRATVGAFVGLAFGAGAVAANRRDISSIPQSPVQDFHWEEEVVEEVEEETSVPIAVKPDLLTRLKKNAGTIAIFVVAQGFFILTRRRPQRLYNQHLGAYEIWSELIRH